MRPDERKDGRDGAVRVKGYGRSVLVWSITTTAVSRGVVRRACILGVAAIIVVGGSIWSAVVRGNRNAEDIAAANPSMINHRDSEVSAGIR